MKNPFQIFTSPLFGSVRATLEDGKLFVVGADAARALRLVPILRRTEKSVEGERKVDVAPRRRTLVVNESGLYIAAYLINGKKLA